MGKVSKYSRERQRQRRSHPDPEVPLYGKAKHDRIDLGLAILSLMEMPEGGRSSCDIAHVCGCSDEMIREITVRGLKKLQTNPRTVEIARELAGQLADLDPTRF